MYYYCQPHSCTFGAFFFVTCRYLLYLVYAGLSVHITCSSIDSSTCMYTLLFQLLYCSLFPGCCCTHASRLSWTMDRRCQRSCLMPTASTAVLTVPQKRESVRKQFSWASVLVSKWRRHFEKKTKKQYGCHH